ncbi:hypothetical protein RRG08_005976 [Elysia crispata]|uniref:Uncharacterized protein n=1 Tax=Elysia crispata TaxID=231223 RepID=A0AAE1D329_9GAST|nr:hypothetical protein RRG08_005976 [Elysia crispata]
MYRMTAAIQTAAKDLQKHGPESENSTTWSASHEVTLRWFRSMLVLELSLSDLRAPGCGCWDPSSGSSCRAVVGWDVGRALDYISGSPTCARGGWVPSKQPRH